MDENKTPYQFNLTLDPTSPASAPEAPQPAAPEVPTAPGAMPPTAAAAAAAGLTLNATAPGAAPAAAQATPAVKEFGIDSLTPEEQAAVREFSKKIDITDSSQILSYGSNAQKNISEFSDRALSTVRTKDLGEIGNMLTGLVGELQGLDPNVDEGKGLHKLFHRGQATINDLRAKYSKAEVNVDNIVKTLDQHWITLNKDIVTMDQMYALNEAYFKELSMYIIAGKLRAEELRATVLPEMVKKAEQSGLPEDAQAANDYASMLGRFEKRLHDLELTRMISIQMGPQIRMIQNNDSLMAEKIQTAIVNTIPLWKSQMVLAMSMYHSQQAMEATHNVNEVTNALLKKNAETLHMGSVAVAQEAERGIVDLETLQQTNAQLISTLQEVRQIQDDGRSRRAAAEQELARLETELKSNLLSMRG